MELRGLGDVQQELQSRGGTILALAVDPPDKSKVVVAKNSLPFPILSDTDRSMLQAYSLVHTAGGMSGEDIAIPAMILISQDRAILWRRVAKKSLDRPDPKDVLASIRAALNR